MKLSNSRVLLAGRFDTPSDDDIRARLKAAGAELATELGPEVDVVFVGEEAGETPALAREMGIEVAGSGALLRELDIDVETDEPEFDLEPPAYLMEDIPLPDEEWMPADEPGPPGDVPPPEELRSASSRPSGGDKAGNKAGKKGGDSGTPGERTFERGAEVKIVGGIEGVGVVGEIFWWGNSKYGEGMRAGVKGPGDVTYWVDEQHLGWPDDEVPADVLEAAESAPDLGKGDRVRVTGGKGAGSEGVIFWWGESRYGDGMRAGVETDDGEKVWADAADLEKLEQDERIDEDEDIPF